VFWKRRKSGLSREQALGALPLRNQALSYRMNEDNEAEVTIKRRDDWVGKLFARFFYVPKERKVVLESIGTEVWELCDGQHTVEEIARELAKRHKLTLREAEVALTQYLRTLGKKRLIVFAVPKQEHAAVAEAARDGDDEEKEG